MRSLRMKQPSMRVGAPLDWNEERDGPCGALDVQVFNDPLPCMMSAWRPNKEELALLNAGKPLLFFVYGNVHPVVSLEVQDADMDEFVQEH